jgi:hypothetical protein
MDIHVFESGGDAENKTDVTDAGANGVAKGQTRFTFGAGHDGDDEFRRGGSKADQGGSNDHGRHAQKAGDADGSGHE